MIILILHLYIYLFMKKTILFSLFFLIYSLTGKAQETTIVDCNAGPITSTFCYDTGADNSYLFTSSDGSPLNLVIDSGEVENGWDEFFVYDSDGVTELTPAQPFYGNGGDLSGLTFQSSGDNITIVVQEDSSISCVSSTSIDPITLTVSCATCINPVSYTHLRAHETPEHLVCRLLLVKKNLFFF